MILSEVPHDAECTVKSNPYSIKVNSKAFSILSSNIYTRKVEAVIREISCNAHDAHTDASIDRPFDVHLPTYYEPFFSVRDYGYGLTEEDMHNVYTCLFESTKTGSNSFIGALGLGSKSPFCIVDSFVVISYNGGQKITYSCFMGKDRTPQIAILDKEATSETGLEVSVNIPTHMISEFSSAAVRVFEYFEKLPNINVKSTVEAIASRKNNYCLDMWDSKGYRIRNDGSWGDSYAVMGNVAYRIDSSLITNKRLYGIDVKFSIGEISFNPGRESLSLDENTFNIVRDKLQLIVETVCEDIIGVVESEPTTWRKYIAFQNCKERMQFPADVVSKYTPVELDSKAVVYQRKVRKSNVCSSNKITEIPVTGYTFYLTSTGATSKIKHHVRTSGAKAIVLTQEQIDKIQIDQEFINDPHILPAPPKNKVSGDHYDCYEYTSVDNFDKVVIDPEDDSEKVYIFHNGKRALSEKEAAIMRSVGLFGVTESFCNRKKFKSGNFISLKSYIEREYQLLTGEVCYLDESEIRVISEIDGEKADRVRKALQFADANKERIKLGHHNLNDIHSVAKEVLTENPLVKLVHRFIPEMSSVEISSLVELMKNGKEKAKN